jgi:uncharacterized protein with HEPN domain
LSRDKDALLDMLKMIELIEDHGPKDEQSLRTDVVRQAATLSWLKTLGAAADTVSMELKAAHPEIPWQNLALPEYDQVRLDDVWSTIQHELLPLANQLTPIANGLE